MTECCGPSAPCCGGTPEGYDYGPAPYVIGQLDTFAGPVSLLATTLTAADRRGGRRVRLGIARSDYRVRPGLYAVGEPDDTSPVLVTGNYKLTVDAVRSELIELNVWLLVIDSRGVNVWCSAGKGVFSTAEVVRMVREARLEQIVSHTRLVLPQLAATGVAAHDVRAQTGFSCTWGPVRAADLPAFLGDGMKASPAMRRVEFSLNDRSKLVAVELSLLWRPRTLLALGIAVAATAVAAVFAPAYAVPIAVLAIAGALAVAIGAVLTPLLLPWLPGRAFSLKGGVAGFVTLTLLAAAAVVATGADTVPLWAWGLVAAGSALASFVAMNFTGSSTYTSPSGVEWEMRRAIPAQLAAASVGVVLYAVGLLGLGG